MSVMGELSADKETFEKILLSTEREGIEDLLKYLESTDFYTAPGSTKYHDSEPGGLLHHSLNVYSNLVRFEKLFEGMYSDDTLKIVGLLHDVCKANFYKLITKQLPKRGSDGKIIPNPYGGKIWEDSMMYIIEDQFPLGHGEKSVILIQKYIRLTDAEIFAIRWHMLAFDDLHGTYAGNIAISGAAAKHPLIVLTHIADLSASFLKVRL